MKQRSLLAGAAFLSVVALPGAAAAIDGFATGSVNVRAGPSTDYQVLTTLYPGAPVEVYGCLSGHSWCDIYGNGARGWVSANYLQIAYGGDHVYLPSYASVVGIPTVSFSFGFGDDDDRRWRDRDRDHDWDRDRDYSRAELNRLENRRENWQDRRERLRNRIDQAMDDGNRDRAQRIRDRLQDRREDWQDKREDILCPGPRCPRG